MNTNNTINMKAQFLAAVTAIAILLTPAAFAQDNNTRQTPKKSVEEVAQTYTEKIAKELNLNDKQKEQFNDLCASHIKQQRAQREAMRAQKAEMHKRLQEILTPKQYAQWKESKCHIPGHKAVCDKQHKHHHAAMHKCPKSADKCTKSAEKCGKSVEKCNKSQTCTKKQACEKSQKSECCEKK